MRHRSVLLVALLTLLSLGVLSARPIVADVLRIPPLPQQLRSVETGDAGGHCRMVADCHVMSATTVPFDVLPGTTLLLLAGLALLLSSVVVRPAVSFAPLHSTPPPRSASS